MGTWHRPPSTCKSYHSWWTYIVCSSWGALPAQHLVTNRYSSCSNWRAWIVMMRFVLLMQFCNISKVKRVYIIWIKPVTAIAVFSQWVRLLLVTCVRRSSSFEGHEWAASSHVIGVDRHPGTVAKSTSRTSHSGNQQWLFPLSLNDKCGGRGGGWSYESMWVHCRARVLTSKDLFSLTRPEFARACPKSNIRAESRLALWEPQLVRKYEAKYSKFI